MLQFRSTEEISYIALSDDAIDGEATGSDMSKYVVTMDESKLKLKPGSTPTRFKLRRLTRKQALRIGIVGGQALSAEQENEVVACGLRGVDLPSVRLEFNATGDRLTEDSLDKIYAPDLFHELATQIVRLSGLAPLGV